MTCDEVATLDPGNVPSSRFPSMEDEPGYRRTPPLDSKDMQLPAPPRIIVLARPDLARRVEIILRGAGYEIYRTPDAAGVDALAARIRPHLVIIAQDIPWADTTETPCSLTRRLPHLPVLLIGESRGGDTFAAGLPSVPSPVEHVALQVMVARLLGPGTGAARSPDT